MKSLETSQRPSRLARWTVFFTFAALLIAGCGLTLARYDLIPKLAGFGALVGGALAALIAVLLGLAALITTRRRPDARGAKLLPAILVSLLYVAFIVSRPFAAGSAPAIHDITTDLANPPQFETIHLRPDNLVGVDNLDNWRKIHGAAYGDLRTVTIAKPVPEVTDIALKVAKKAGWDIVSSDPARGHIEATASVSYIRFHDDVVIRIVPTGDGKSSNVDVRSVSRVGVGDLGVNARRIRTFLEALRAA
jgi:uncharacterized protein (DUF1499 family)